MRSAAFRRAERTRRRQRPVSARQRGLLAKLAREQGIETPRPRWSSEASEAITRLKQRAAQPTLEGFEAAA